MNQHEALKNYNWGDLITDPKSNERLIKDWGFSTVQTGKYLQAIYFDKTKPLTQLAKGQRPVVSLT